MNMDNKFILYVEDSPIDELLVLKALKEGQIADQTITVRDGQEAVDFLYSEGVYSDRPQVNPAVILLDLKLPKITGLDVLKKIRSTDSTKHIPIIILTCSKEEKDLVECFSCGANRYLIKPVQVEELNESLRHFMSYYAGMIRHIE